MYRPNHNKLLFLALCAITTLLSGMPRMTHAACKDWAEIMTRNRSIFEEGSNDKRVLILPFINETKNENLQWVSDALRLGLFLMLENAEKSDVIEVRSTQTSFDVGEALQLGRAAGAGQARRPGRGGPPQPDGRHEDHQAGVHHLRAGTGPAGRPGGRPRPRPKHRLQTHRGRQGDPRRRGRAGP